MIASLEKLIDRSAIQVMTLMMPAKEYDWRLEEALRFLKGPSFVSTDSQPAQVEFNGSLHFRFPTPQRCEFTENNVVHGLLQQRVEVEKRDVGIVVGIVDEHGSRVVSCGKMDNGTDEEVNGDTLFDIASWEWDCWVMS